MMPRAVLVAPFLLCLVLLWSTTACAQEPAPDSSNRGSGSHTSDTSVENTHLIPRFIPGSCTLHVGGVADLRFTAINNRPVDVERLLAISSTAVDKVWIEPDSGIEIQPGHAVSVGAGSPTAGGNRQLPAVVVNGLEPMGRPGNSIEMVFSFHRAGDITTRVPIADCPIQK